MSNTSIDRKEQIMRTTQKLFRQKGYAATSMRDIAQELEIEASSLYNYIKSKEELLQQTCFKLAAEFQKEITEVNDIYFNGEEKLRMAIKNHVGIITSNLDAAFVFLREWRHLSEPHLSEFIELRNRYENEFTQILKTGEKEHVFKESDSKFAVLTILSAVNWIVEWYNPEGTLSPEEIAEKLSDFILKGLKETNPVY